MKNLITFLCLIMATSISANAFVQDGITYQIVDATAKTCAVSSGDNCGASVVIPSEANGYTVTEIANNAFFRKTDLTSIDLPPTLQKIGATAFIGTGLQAVHLPKALNTIGIGAFAECLSLTDLTVDPENTSFSSADGIVYNKSKSKVVCAAAGLSEFNIAKSVSTIGNCAFMGCRKVTSITLPAPVSLIDNSAFNGCSALSEINIPANVYEIGSSAFSGCSSLTSIEIPAKTQKIGAGAFGGCASLAEFSINPENPTFRSKNGLVLNRYETNLLMCPPGLKTVVFPETVTRIEGSAFTGCCRLEYLVIPSTVTSIGSYAFRNCGSLKTVIIPEGIPEILYNTFQNCTSLTNVIFPSTVTEIGASAFSGCTSLTTIGFPPGLETIKAFAFKGCTNLRCVVFGETVKTIEMQSFQESDNIEEVVCYATQMPTLSATAFDETVLQSADLRVNPANIEEYKESDRWGQFLNISDIEEKLATAIVLDHAEYETKLGESFPLSAAVYPHDASSLLVNWSSDNPDIADVDEAGEVHITGIGTCEITAEAENNPNVKNTCRILAADLESGVDSIMYNEDTDLEESNLDLYTLDGQLLIPGMQSSQLSSLPKGVYIIRSGNHAKKVMIK